ncbi:MAG: alpha/beta hydrolase [Bacteroidota bacterium]
MNWKYVKLAFLVLLILLIAVPSFRYFASIDWSKQHSNRIATLPLLTATDTVGEFRLPIGEFELLVRVAGLQNEGPGVVLLHGFPESSIMWRPLLEQAATEGYRVIAFDQRGYSPGARPTGVSHYHIDSLTQDVIDVADHMGFDQFHLVGHDWGAVLSWNVAMEYPERLLTLTALSIPHIGVFFDAVMNHPEQQERSSYFKLLQLPLLPEYRFVANDQQFYKQMMSKNHPDYLAEYLALYGEYGAATAALNWYRALDVEEMASNKIFKRSIQAPTLYIWGKEDGVIAPAIIPQQEALIEATYREISLETGHGLIQTKPDTVIQEILRHFAG